MVMKFRATFLTHNIARYDDSVFSAPNFCKLFSTCTERGNCTSCHSAPVPCLQKLTPNGTSTTSTTSTTTITSTITTETATATTSSTSTSTPTPIPTTPTTTTPSTTTPSTTTPSSTTSSYS